MKIDNAEASFEQARLALVKAQTELEMLRRAALADTSAELRHQQIHSFSDQKIMADAIDSSSSGEDGSAGSASAKS